MFETKTVKQNEANGRVIAAAPELRAALVGAMQILAMVAKTGDGTAMEALEAARAALAKAEGR